MYIIHDNFKFALSDKNLVLTSFNVLEGCMLIQEKKLQSYVYGCHSETTLSTKYSKVWKGGPDPPFQLLFLH